MFTETLDNKPVYKRPDGIEIKDLTSTKFLSTNNISIPFNVYKVSKEYEMRPDLISNVVYNDPSYAEFILKFNGISNPFTLKEGDIILIPNLSSMKTLVSNNSEKLINEEQKIRDKYKYLDPLKIPKPGQGSAFQNRNISRIGIVGGAVDGALPPNIVRGGESQITYRNGRVYFGAGTNTCLSDGMTQSEFLTNVIKTRNNKQ